nr:NAD-dependent epimerase [Deltaproteobacteria bacterium]
EDTPFAPVCKKGEYRVHATERLLAAHRAGNVRVAIGRASDFFGPATPLAHFGERFYQRVLAGKPGECIGDPDMPHTYSYSPDVARGLVTLGLDERGDGKTWMLPVQPAESARAVTNRMGKALGREIRVTRVPKLAMRLLGVFSSQMAELVEMTYQWEQPFVVDDSRFRATFGGLPTDWDAAIAATIGWAAPTYARAAKAA